MLDCAKNVNSIRHLQPDSFIEILEVLVSHLYFPASEKIIWRLTINSKYSRRNHESFDEYVALAG